MICEQLSSGVDIDFNYQFCTRIVIESKIVCAALFQAMLVKF